MCKRGQWYGVVIQVMVMMVMDDDGDGGNCGARTRNNTVHNIHKLIDNPLAEVEEEKENNTSNCDSVCDGPNWAC